MIKWLTIILTLMFSGAYAQWELVNGPYRSSDNISMTFRELRESNKFIAALSDDFGYSDGILISPNNGKSWLKSDAGISDYTSRSIDIKDSVIVVGTIWGGVFVSTNYGTSFQQISDGLPEGESVYYVAITDSSFVASSSSTLNSGYQLYYLPIGAQEWIESEGFPTGFPLTAVERFYVDGERIYAATSTGLYVSLDYGATWEITGMTIGIGNVLAIDNKIFVSGTTTGEELQFSDDFGETWTVNTSNFPTPFVKSFAYNEDKVFAISSTNELYTTLNNGNYWSASSGGLDCGNLYDIIVYGDTAVIYCAGNGPGYSYNGGSNWSNWTKTYGQEIRSLTVSGGNLVAAADYKVHASGDHGESWTSFNNTYNVVHALDSVVLGGSSNGLRFSYDNGVTFGGSTPPGLPYPASITEINSKGSIVMLYAVDHGIFYSVDTAQSFVDRTGELVSEYINSITFLDTLVFVGTEGAGLYVSHDYGLNWEFTSGDIPDSTIQVIHEMNGVLLAGTKREGLFKSEDSGNSWEVVNVGSAERDTSILAIFNNGCEIYLSSQRSGVFMSADCGESWNIKNEGLINRNVNTFCALDGYLFAGTDGASVWRTPIEYLDTQIDELQERDDDVSVTLFPNPVSGLLSVRSDFNVWARFRIIDAQGRMLIDGSGNINTKTFDTASLTHGIYILLIETEDWVISRKFIKD